MNRSTLLALAEFPQQLATHYAAIPADFKHWRPASWAGIPSAHYTESRSDMSASGRQAFGK